MTLQPESTHAQRILVIMAHPDDIEFGLAGSVAQWVKAGSHVTYCLVTDGSAGSNDPNVDLEDLIETRQIEQKKAAAVVGVHEVLFLGYRDGVLEHTLELRRHLTRLIRQLQPERVVTFDPTMIIAESQNYINHPDHRAVGEAAMYAVFPSAETRPIFPELLAEGLNPHKVRELYLVFSYYDNTYVDISDNIALKMEALRQHQTQLAQEDLSFVEKWAADAGGKVGVRFAEIFRVIRRDPPTLQS